MSYDKKLCERAVEYWAAGHTKAETAAVFKVGTATYQKNQVPLACPYL